jgi:dTDP-4-dehydrorhamnose 3,5-epimerase-like enzyme
VIDSRRTTVYDCSVLYFPKIENRAGNISPLENNRTIPFEVKRVYYLYDVPGGETRGGHAHKALHQLVIAAGGSFDVLLNDGKNQRVVNLNRPYLGLYIVPGMWRELLNFSSGSICLVLASTHYDESDYIRDYNHFLNFKGISL